MKMKYDFGDSVQVAVTHRPCEIVAITRVENRRSTPQLEAFSTQLNLAMVAMLFFQRVT
jgi:hypothetical protein